LINLEVIVKCDRQSFAYQRIVVNDYQAG